MGGDFFYLDVFMTAEHTPVPVVRVLFECSDSGFDVNAAEFFWVCGYETVGEQLFARDGKAEVVKLPVLLGVIVIVVL